MTEYEKRQLEDCITKIRQLEDNHIRFETIIELMKKIDNRVELLEKHDEEFMSMVHSSCDLKNKEIATARDDAIKISTDYAKSNHEQTLKLLGGLFVLFVSAVGYLGVLSNALTANHVEIEGVKHSIDKIDPKMDKIIETQALILNSNKEGK